MLEQIIEPLLEWYEKNKRELPWRQEPTPYHVWVSEIMLQQTRVEAVKEYYKRFLSNLPKIEDLAVCPEDRLMKLWEGLGYYNRVKNMQKAAKVIVNEFGGKFPDDYEKILDLPGIGSYTAGAVSSIAFGIKKPAVDGNVLRVIARIMEDDGDILKQSVKRKVEQQLEAVMPVDKPGTFNQSLMELGAVICIPNGMPKCGECPVNHVCRAKAHDTIGNYPVKAVKKKRRIEEKTVLLIQDGQEFAICRRPDKGLLAGLYELPNLEGYLTEDEAIQAVRDMDLTPLFVKRAEDAKHIFSHVEWHMRGYIIRIAEVEKKEYGNIIFADKKDSERKYAIPSAFSVYRKYIEEDF